MIALVTDAWKYFCDRGIAGTIAGRDAPFLIKFGKYGICGVLSLLVLLSVLWLCRMTFPEHFALTIDEGLRARNNTIIQFVAFVPSNCVAYYLNRKLVFEPGRHGVLKECGLFTLISFISFSLGLVLPIVLVNAFNVSNGLADASLVISSAVINFICRKVFVFAS